MLASSAVLAQYVGTIDDLDTRIASVCFGLRWLCWDFGEKQPPSDSHLFPSLRPPDCAKATRRRWSLYCPLAAAAFSSLAGWRAARSHCARPPCIREHTQRQAGAKAPNHPKSTSTQGTTLTSLMDWSESASPQVRRTVNMLVARAFGAHDASALHANVCGPNHSPRHRCCPPLSSPTASISSPTASISSPSLA